MPRKRPGLYKPPINVKQGKLNLGNAINAARWLIVRNQGSTAHRITLSSLEPVARVRPSGEKSIAVTPPL